MLLSSNPGTHPYESSERSRPPQHASAPPPEVHWTVDDLDRIHRLFRDDAVLVRGQSRETAASYYVSYRNFRAFLVARAGVGAPVGIRLFAIDEWLRWNRERSATVAPTTLHTYWAKLRSFFEYLERVHQVPSPFGGLKPPPLPSRVPKARSANECLRILEAARQYPWANAFDRARAVAIIALALYAGLRRAEVLHLRYLDVDLEQGVIRVERGKGRGGGKDRVIPIGPELRSILDDYLRKRRARNLNTPEFFSGAGSRSGLSVTTFRRIVARVRAASGIPFSFHSLRHSFLTQLLRGGVPIHTVSAIAGHTQITTTAGYLKVFDQDKEDALRRLRY